MLSRSSTSSDGTKPAKRTTRNTLRQSLNLASVGKALADVINKDGKELERRKPVPNAKDAQSRRASTISFSSVTTLEPVAESQSNEASPDVKTITQTKRSSSSMRRTGRASIDETGRKVANLTPSPRAAPSLSRTSSTSSVLRPRTAGTGSALPKYRPKSVIVEGVSKPVSPIRSGTRRKHSSSEEDRPNARAPILTMHSPADKSNRPISPIPRRASKSGISPTFTKGSPSSHSFTRPKAVSSVTSTPSRPRKASKPSESPLMKKSALPRPASQMDSSPASSATPHTPTSAKRAVSKGGRDTPSPLRSSSALNSSPSLRRGVSKCLKSTKGSPAQRMQHSAFSENVPCIYTEDVSSDSLEAGDVELMLAPIASPSAPTPAIPRLRTFNYDHHPPQTPSRSSLRPPQPTIILPPHGPANQNSRSSSKKSSPERKPALERSSVAAWEKLADLSAEINASELGGLITDVDAPFLPATPGILPPSPSVMRLESESLTGLETPLTMPSPGRYASISQMLLPTITPSPAVRTENSLYLDTNGGIDVPAMDSATVTLLKLQLASMENLAKERLAQITRIEEEMHILKETRKREEQSLSTQLAELELRLHEALAAPNRSDSEGNHDACRAMLDDRVRREAFLCEKAVADAISRVSESERSARDQLFLRIRKNQSVSLVARDVTQCWQNVCVQANDQLQAIITNRDTLAVLRANLDFCESQLQSTFIPSVA